MPDRQADPPPLARWLVAVAAVVVAIALRMALVEFLNPTAFLLFFAAVTVSAWYGGLGPGLLATGLSLIAANALFMAPFHQPSLPDPRAIVRLGLFALEGLLVSSLSASLRDARLHAQRSHEEAEHARREASEALERSREGRLVQDELRARLASIVETSEDAIFSTTLGGVVMSWNRGAERMYGYEAREMLGRAIGILLPADRARDVADILAEITEGRPVGPIETVRVRKDGTTVDVSLTVSALRDGDGRVIGASSISRDITEQKRHDAEVRQLNEALEQRVRDRTAELERANHQLENANKELEAFSYSVSHDLRAPLRALDGFSRILLDEYADKLDDEAQRYLGLVRDNAQRMGALVNDLLKFSRLSRQPLEKTDVVVAEVVQEALLELAPEREGRSFEVTVGELPRALADRGLLKQVFVNLLSNAIKYTRGREPARIEVGARPSPDGATVYFVRDNGVGFDMRYAGKLFGVFQRLHRPDEYEGTGVGLALTQRIVYRHDGRIWAEAEPDHGATFSFTLGGGAAEPVQEPGVNAAASTS